MRRVYFRADAGPNIGYGHFIRSLALADMLKNDFDCTFFTQSPTEYQRQEVAKVCKLQELSPTDEKFATFLSYLDGTEIVVLDNYFFDTDYQREIKSMGCKLVCIDDRPGQIFYSDVVINHLIGITPNHLTAPKGTKLLLGPKFALLRPAFCKTMFDKPTYHPENNEILVAMGGTDYYNITGKITQMLSTFEQYKINVLLGDKYKWRSKLQHKSITIHQNIDDAQLANLISNQKIVITPPSTLAYEVCAVGCPLIIGSFAENHINAERLLADSGLGISCGSFLTLTISKLRESIYKTIDNHLNILTLQKKIFDGLQRKRIVTVFKEMLC